MEVIDFILVLVKYYFFISMKNGHVIWLILWGLLSLRLIQNKKKTFSEQKKK